MSGSRVDQKRSKGQGADYGISGCLHASSPLARDPKITAVSLMISTVTASMEEVSRRKSERRLKLVRSAHYQHSQPEKRFILGYFNLSPGIAYHRVLEILEPSKEI